MGLFGFIKGQMLEIVELIDERQDVLVHRFTMQKRERIMNSSTLVVRPSQVAVFVHKGQICDIFTPGTYKLATENIPIITKLLSLPTGFDSPIKAEIYFVSTKQINGIKWGTQNPIMIRDEEFGNVRLRSFGVFSFKVNNPRKFMEEAFGTNAIFTKDNIINHLKPAILQSFADSVAESKISALDLAAEYVEFSETIKHNCKPAFDNFGLKISSLIIENISLPEELEKALDERSKLGMFADRMGTYTQIAAADALKDMAKNEGGAGAFVGMGAGMGTGMGLGGLMANSLANAKDQPKQKQQDKKVCSNCNSNIKSSAKFCPECGEVQKQNKHCTNCGTEIKASAKFCPECGEKQ